MDVQIKRVYDGADPADGRRVLVDRLWPRGVTRDEAAVDAWDREVAPSPELRRWFDHDPERFAEFSRRYREELQAVRPRLTELRRHARRGRLTLVYAAKDGRHNHALVLAEALRRGLPRPSDHS